MTAHHKINLQRRAVARGPLSVLVQWCAYHAMQPLAGHRLDATLWVLCHGAVRRGLAALADTGALRYFDIRDAGDLGDAPVELYVVSDGEPPFGRCQVDPMPTVRWILAGGARGQGWKQPSEISADDLG